MGKIGSTKADLTGFVKVDTEIAGIQIGNGITAAQLSAEGALNLKNLAHANTATGSTTLDTIDSIEMDSVTVAGNATVTFADATATLTKVPYTPAGTITGDAISGGSINVTLKDSAAATSATLTKSDYTPEGTIAAADGGSFVALKSAELAEATTGGVQIQGDVSSPAINLTSSDKTVAIGLTGGSTASFTEGAFTPASFQTGFVTPGTAASWTGQDYTAPTLGDATTAAFVNQAVIASISTTDPEMLVFTAAPTANAVTAQGTFSAGNVNFGTFNGGTPTAIDTSKFDGGSKAADSFTANTLQQAETDTIANVTGAALASSPVFTGKSYNISTTTDTALKQVIFTGTKATDALVTEVKYTKQEVDEKSFTPTASTLGFSGTEVADLIPTEVTYQKANATAAFSETVTPAVKQLNRTAKDIEITVQPD